VSRGGERSVVERRRTRVTNGARSKRDAEGCAALGRAP